MNRASQALESEERDRLVDEARVAEAIEQGLADVQAGRVIDDDAVDEVLRARLGDLID
ncbi:hypothetical protein [Paraliomyxa miuraensis]|uniref:hypothetical protein n=1 Tax=Paraliomyxa miuraensis TaxID=376150 RepID=UPI002259AA22|nr:hypothetical protein [Paraliomyxa miuraensis]MCX4243958.1 hypothetical protein [Paraliomyxa miuraensis]